MSPTFLVNAYRLLSVLCLLQIGSGLAAILIYGIDGIVASQYLQITPILFGILTLERIYRLLPYTRRTDTTIFSRVHMHYALFVFNPVLWVVCALALQVVESRILPASIAACRANRFMAAKCIPVGMNLVLPYALIVTQFSVSQVLRRRARAIHGAEMVPMPQPVPRPWLYSDQVVPAWMTPHVAEFDEVSLEEGDNKSPKA
ncbi:hypothetical protein B0H10DRAFT_1984913 [Mycena sp. CBHHK59/15]|nr:hypothetical protein B0H10DRAFT_1984913 [Mycena sp. CBHHK59/15]